MSDSEDEGLEPAAKLRRFQQAPENELLPLKVNGKLIRRFKPHDIKEEIKDEEDVDNEEKHIAEVEVPQLSVQELLLKQKIALDDIKQKICGLSNSIISFPQENIGKLKELRELCEGGANIDALVREKAQKLAVASLTEVFVGIVPGYAIRPLTDDESRQQMRSETKKVVHFETALLTNYQRFLQMLEKNVMKLTKSKEDENTFTAKIGMISAKCLCKLLNKVSHFNFTVNIVSCLVHLTKSSNAKLLNEVCSTFSEAIREDFRLELSMHIAKTVANFVNIRKGRVSPQLLRTFLSLRIKDVEKNCKAEQEEEDQKKKKILQAKRFSRNAKKDMKRRRKIEDPLREAEAAEKISTKIKLATETMKFVFITYFRVLKRMPTTTLVEPVLEGLAKFAHLINVEFFNDLIRALSNLLEQNDLKLSDSLRCVKTVCMILSHDGQVLNIDPLYFYNALFALMPTLAFQSESAICAQIELLVESLDVLLVKRRRLIPLKRVAAFVKRMAILALLLPSNRCVLAILSAMRSTFIAHPTLAASLAVEGVGDEEDCVMNGIFQPDSTDPDTSNSLCTTIGQELKFISKCTNNTIVKAFCGNLLHQVPSTGEFRLNPQWATRPPRSWLLNDDEKRLAMANSGDSDRNVDMTESLMVGRENNPLRHRVDDFCKKKKIALSSKNVCSTVCKFLDQCAASN